MRRRPRPKPPHDCDGDHEDIEASVWTIAVMFVGVTIGLVLLLWGVFAVVEAIFG